MSAARAPQASVWSSLLLLVAALLCFAVLDTTTKRVTEVVPPMMAVWVLFLVQAIASTTFVGVRRGLGSLKTAHWQLQIVRGALLLAVQLLAFFSLMVLPVGEFTAMAMTTPLLVTLFAARVLGEHVSLLRLLLVGGGLTGTLIIVRPGSGAFGWALLLPMGLVAFNTVYQLLTSRMARTEDAVSTLVYTSLTAVTLVTLSLPWVWAPVNEPVLWLGLLLMGLAASGGNLLFILAFERAPAATLMPYMYLQIGFGLLGGWLVFAHVPDFWALVGMALVAACGVAGGLLTLHEARARQAALAMPQSGAA